MIYNEKCTSFLNTLLWLMTGWTQSSRCSSSWGSRCSSVDKPQLQCNTEPARKTTALVKVNVYAYELPRAESSSTLCASDISYFSNAAEIPRAILNCSQLLLAADNGVRDVTNHSFIWDSSLETNTCILTQQKRTNTHGNRTGSGWIWKFLIFFLIETDTKIFIEK